MKLKQQQLYKILRNFEGMSKLDAFDVLHKMEVLLFYANSPIQKKQLKKIILSDMDVTQDIDPFQFTILSNGNFCEFVAANDWIYVYKEVRRGVGRLSPIPRYYFKTKYAPLELLRLTSQNMLTSIEDTPHESAILNFLNTNQITARDKDTGVLLIIEVD